MRGVTLQIVKLLLKLLRLIGVKIAGNSIRPFLQGTLPLFLRPGVLPMWR